MSNDQPPFPREQDQFTPFAVPQAAITTGGELLTDIEPTQLGIDPEAEAVESLIPADTSVRADAESTVRRHDPDSSPELIDMDAVPPPLPPLEPIRVNAAATGAPAIPSSELDDPESYLDSLITGGSVQEPTALHGLLASPDGAPTFDSLMDESVSTSSAPAVPPARMTAEELAAFSAAVQNALESQHLLGTSLVLEVGPFQDLMENVRTLVTSELDPSLAGAVSSTIGVLLHKSLTISPYALSRELSQQVIEAQASLVEDLAQRIGDLTIKLDGESPAQALLPALAVSGLASSRLQGALDGLFVAEKTRLERLAGRIVPATLGDQVFSKLGEFARSAFTSAKAPLTGDIRRHRDQLLGEALQELSKVSEEVEHNSGDPTWERTTGKQSLRLVQDLLSTVRRVSEGVEDQVNQTAISSALEHVDTRLRNAKKKSDDEEQKRLIEEATAALAKLLRSLREAVANLLGMGGKPPSSPLTASRPAPHA